MIVTGIFIFLLGTKLGESVPTPAKTEVTYEGPNQITITEDTGDDRILPENIPQSGPNFIQQGSNFYFNPIFPTAVIPQIVERIIPTLQKKTIATKTEIDVLVEEKPVALDPLIEVEPVKLAENFEPEIIVQEVLIQEGVPVLIPEAPELPPIVIPELPLQVNALPDLIIEPIVPEVSIPVLPDIEITAPVFAQEIDITLDEIPSPPELPPLVIVEKPTIVEDKTVILVPAAPVLRFEAIVPPKLVVENSVLPTMCARNIVIDRVLPRIIYEKTQKLELISFPTARIVPVAANIDRPILRLVSNQ